MSKNDPAFPLTEDAVNFKNKDFPMQGLTKLEWFAGMALQGLLRHSTSSVNSYDSYLVECAYDLAELMIAEAQKRGEK